MKTRQGFVSNSSSSSFIVYGVMCDSKEDMFKLKMQNSPAEVFTSLEEAGSLIDEIKEELELEEFTVESLKDEEVIDWLVNNGSEWDLFYDMEMNGYEVHSTDESDDGSVVGVSVGSCDYGISELGDIEQIIKDHKANLMAAFGEEPALYSVYTGY